MKKIKKILCLLICGCLLAGCAAQQNADNSVSTQTPVSSKQFNRSYASDSFKNMLQQYPDIRELIEKSIA